MTGQQPDVSPVAKMRANLAAMRAQGATVEEQKAEMDRWKPRIAEYSAGAGAERADYGKLGRVGGILEGFTEGATLGGAGLIGDAAAAAFDPNASFADVRRQRREREAGFAAANPKTALAAGFTGAVLTPGLGVGKAIGTAGKGVGAMLRRGAGMAAEGALGAGIEGAVRGTDDFTGDAMKRALSTGVRDAFVGAVAAPIVGGTLGAGARGLARLRQPAATAGVKTLARGVDGLQQGPAGLYSEQAGELMGSPDVMAADVLTGGARKLRAAMNVSPAGEELAATRLRERGANVVDRARQAAGRATGLSSGDIALTKAQMLAEQGDEADRLFGQARQEGREFDAIPGRVADRFREMEQVAAQKALPGPGQSVSAKRDLPRPQDVDGDIAWPGVPKRVPRETVAQEMGREALETRRPSRMSPTGERPVVLRAANDVNVRRDFETPAPVASTPDRFAAAQTSIKRALDNDRVQQEVAAIADDNPDLAAVDPGSFDMLSKVYQRLNKEFGVLKKRGENAGEYFNALQTARRTVRKALSARSATFDEANAAFAEKVRQSEAYQLGTKLFSKRVPAGELKLAMEGMTPDQQRLFRRGSLDALTGKIGEGANPDLGASARQSKRTGQVAIESANAKDRIREIFGQDAYLQFLKEARREGAFSETAAGALQNSTTAKQLADMGIFGTLADDAAGSLSMSPTATAGNFLARGLRRTVDRGARLLNEGGNREAADLLTRPGRTNVEALMAQVKDELGRREAARQTGQRVAAQSARGARALVGDR